jgi:hypothetical protein
MALAEAPKPAEAPVTNLVAFPALVKVKNPAAVALGKLGGSKGGKTRAERLSSEEKSSIAQQAAKARWAKARLKGEMVGSQPSSKT